MSADQTTNPQKGFYRHRGLPHLDIAGALQFVTFRLADSLPHQVLENASMRELEESLDRGFGACVLKDPSCAGLVRGTLLNRHGLDYDLVAYCVMPNHVHVLYVQDEKHPLRKVVQAWKSVSARKINQNLGLSGPLWQLGYFDRVVRRGELARVMDYIVMNPVKAGLSARPEDWHGSWCLGWGELLA